jgi:SAM-dependent methyltransferase
LRLGAVEDFTRVASLLRSSGYEEGNVCRVLKISSIADIDPARLDKIADKEAESQLLVLLIRIFLLLDPVPCGEVEELVEPQSLRSVIALDLLRTGSFGPTPGDCIEMYYSPVLLYPVTGLLIASDRRSNPDGSPYVTPRDAVFPGIHPGTLDFLRIVSKSRADSILDVGAGSGIGALFLSKYVKKAVATDITPRAMHFTKFNQLLNKCPNVEVVEGDLYSPVEGRTFDRIIAHPPYQPSVLKEQVYYRDAGKAGEDLLGRIVEGLPAHLNPGGAFYCVSGCWDSPEHPFEERLRDWLGKSANEFDSIFAVGDEKPMDRYAADLAEQGDDLARAERPMPDAAGREKFIYGAVFIHRREKVSDQAHRDIQPLNGRERLSSVTDGSSFEWAVRWHRWCAEQELAGSLQEAISSLSPRFGSGLQVRVTYTVQRATLMPSEVVLESGRPFLAMTRVDQWIVPVMGMFDGKRTVREVHRMALESSMLPEQCGLSDFASLTGKLIKCGYLESDEI